MKQTKAWAIVYEDNKKQVVIDLDGNYLMYKTKKRAKKQVIGLSGYKIIQVTIH